MKMTIVRNEAGAIVAFAHLRAAQPGGKFAVGVVAGPGQKVENVEVPDELAALEDGAELHKRITAHLAKPAK